MQQHLGPLGLHLTIQVPFAPAGLSLSANKVEDSLTAVGTRIARVELEVDVLLAVVYQHGGVGVHGHLHFDYAHLPIRPRRCRLAGYHWRIRPTVTSRHGRVEIHGREKHPLHPWRRDGHISSYDVSPFQLVLRALAHQLVLLPRTFLAFTRTVKH